ncbi:hypothetical protein [Domibacillus robiginosus]|uniref:hypothetical protein n=1 Tax=Domibacillus robiginosus TaxID=1071054 RepID=UPI00067A810B|nr:hypothetical protein [Domibacillus robiginosus]
MEADVRFASTNPVIKELVFTDTGSMVFVDLNGVRVSLYITGGSKETYIDENGHLVMVGDLRHFDEEHYREWMEEEPDPNYEFVLERTNQQRIN